MRNLLVLLAFDNQLKLKFLRVNGIFRYLGAFNYYLSLQKFSICRQILFPPPDFFSYPQRSAI